jgi:hypothetical protein
VEQEYDDWDEKRLIGRQRHWYRLEEAFSLLNLYKPSQLCFLERFIFTSPNYINLIHQIKHS